MFFISGFCGLLYQTIWLRLAFAEFGVITPIVSLVVSVFMLGLGLGSWSGGRYISSWKKMMGGSAITVYALIEIFIGLGAFVVPALFRYGANLSDSLTGGTGTWLYLTGSAIVITVSMLPWAIAMGMTYPVVVEFLHDLQNKNLRSFGFLYAANTAGAFLGATLTVLILIEVLGFRRTLLVAALLNFLIGITAAIWSGKFKSQSIAPEANAEPSKLLPQNSIASKNGGLLILFITGFCSMAMEVAWIRSFSVQLGSVVYSFAIVLAIYLFSNWLGATLYRLDLVRNKIKSRLALISMAAFSSTIPLIASCPKMWIGALVFLCNHVLSQRVDSALLLFAIQNSVFVLLIPSSIALFSIILGYLTPLIVDDLSLGISAKAGSAYATNICGLSITPFFGSPFFFNTPRITLSYRGVDHKSKQLTSA